MVTSTPGAKPWVPSAHSGWTMAAARRPSWGAGSSARRWISASMAARGTSTGAQWVMGTGAAPLTFTRR